MITPQEYEALVEILYERKRDLDEARVSLSLDGMSGKPIQVRSENLREATYRWKVARRAIVKLGRANAEKQGR